MMAIDPPGNREVFHVKQNPADFQAPEPAGRQRCD
jgi:hypothetical protein